MKKLEKMKNRIDDLIWVILNIVLKPKSRSLSLYRLDY